MDGSIEGRGWREYGFGRAIARSKIKIYTVQYFK